jgi:type II secretory pathway pseudopilin PulG
MLKRLKNTKGASLTELIVGMLVLSIIMLAVITVFLPVYNAFVHANNLAEVNNLLNALSSVIMSDIESARAAPEQDPGTGILTIPIRSGVAPVEYDAPTGLLTRHGAEVFDTGFYKRKTVAIDLQDDGAISGIVEVTLTIFDRDGFEMATRTYAARPMGLQ